MEPNAFLLDPVKRSIEKIVAARNSDLFRILGGAFASKRTPDNNLAHFLIDKRFNLSPGLFAIKGMKPPIQGIGVVTGSRPFKDGPFNPVNFDDLDILWNVVFMTQLENRHGFEVFCPLSISYGT